MTDESPRIANVRKALWSFVQAMVSAVPELRESYEKHLKTYHDEPLSYIYLPDALRDLAERLVTGRATIDTIKRLCGVIEVSIETRNRDVHDLIGLAILDEIEGTILFPLMRNEFGPRTRQLLLEGWGWTPPQSSNGQTRRKPPP